MAAEKTGAGLVRAIRRVDLVALIAAAEAPDGSYGTFGETIDAATFEDVTAKAVDEVFPNRDLYPGTTFWSVIA